MNSKISVITVCLNSEVTIEDTIKSVLQQDYKNVESIIIDGGSIDGTLDIVSKYRSRIAKFISEPDKGIYDAMNKGLRLVTGEYVAFLNADDVYANTNVISCVAETFESKKADAVYGDIIYVDKFNSDKVVRYWKTGEYKPRIFFKGWVPPHPAFFCRKEIYDKYGGFLDDMRIAGDFELMLRFMEKYKIKSVYLPEILVKMRSGGKANVISGIVRGNKEIIRSFLLNGFGMPASFYIYKPITKIKQIFKRPLQ